MTRFKKLLSVTLSVAVLSSAFSAVSFAAESEKDYTIGEAYWDESDTKAMGLWDEPENKTSYKIQLFKGNNKVGSLQSTSAEQYDFTRLIIGKGAGKYTFTVYPNKGGKALLVTSDVLDVDYEFLSSLKKSNPNITASVNANKANKNNTKNNTGKTGAAVLANNNQNTPKGPGVPKYAVGWNQLVDGRWIYADAGYNLAKSSWQNINEKWYYFNDEGIMLSNVWIKTNEKWYYLSNNGDMLVNTVTPDGYTVNANGEWVPN